MLAFALVSLSACESVPAGRPAPVLRDEEQYTFYGDWLPPAVLSGDGRTLLAYAVNEAGILPFMAPFDAPNDHIPGLELGYGRTTAWRGFDPTGTALYAVRQNGTIVRTVLAVGKGAEVGAVNPGVVWVEPLWARGSLLIASALGERGVSVVEWPSAGGSVLERFRSDDVNDVVFDAQLHPRYLLQRTRSRGRGFDFQRVSVLDPSGRVLGTEVLQPGWVQDPTPAPRVGDGPVHLLAAAGFTPGDDLVGLGVVDARGWTPIWNPAWGDATRWLVRPDGTVDAVGEYGERLHWTGFDEDGRALVALQARLGMDVDVIARSDDRRRWIVEAWSGSSPAQEFAWDRDDDSLKRVDRRDDHAAAATDWHSVEPLVLTVRDGLKMAAYVTTPDVATFGPAPWPLVVRVHGGPWVGQETWTWDEEAQRLADQGYAVLAENFRGTRGFGWSLINGGEFGDDGMIGDVDDAITWAVSSGLAEAERVAMVGASYGGYATLRFATADPVRIRCGVAGLTYGNLTTPSGRLNLEDIRTPEWREAHSPDRFTERMTAPVLIWTGAYDGDHPDAIADFVQRAQANHKQVTWVRFADEGHGLDLSADRRAQWALQGRFLADCLGGPSRPLTDALREAHLEVRAGVEGVVGLAEALPPNTPASP